MNQNKVPILTVHDKEYQDLYQAFFKHSLNLNKMSDYFININSIIDVPLNINDYGYLSNRYIFSRIFQINNIISFIEQNIEEEPGYAISCDVDMILYKNFAPYILNLLRSNTSRMFFMSEDLSFQNPNFGLIIFPVNKQSLLFFQKLKMLLDTTDIIKDNNNFNINSLLEKTLALTGVEYSILDLHFINGNYLFNQKIKRTIKQDLLCAYHATSCYDVIEKMKSLSSFINSQNNSSKIFDGPYVYWQWENIIHKENKE